MSGSFVERDIMSGSFAERDTMSGSFAERDVQCEAFYACAPLCIVNPESLSSLWIPRALGIHNTQSTGKPLSF